MKTLGQWVTGRADKMNRGANGAPHPVSEPGKPLLLPQGQLLSKHCPPKSRGKEWTRALSPDSKSIPKPRDKTAAVEARTCFRWKTQLLTHTLSRRMQGLIEESVPPERSKAH